VKRQPTIVLAMGNDIVADDGAGLAVARELKIEGLPGADIVETGEAGLALVELLEGYRNAVLVDSIKTGKHPFGTILEFTENEFKKVVAPSPHYAGLPEVLELAARLNLEFPKRFRIFALEVENPYEIREGLSPSVAAAIPEMVKKVRVAVEEFTRA
jgi:hydrogenase maturation protease